VTETLSPSMVTSPSLLLIFGSPNPATIIRLARECWQRDNCD